MSYFITGGCCLYLLRQGRELQFIEVTFYVIVGNSCVPNQELDLVYLRFLQTELGGWEKLVHQMHRKE